MGEFSDFKLVTPKSCGWSTFRTQKTLAVIIVLILVLHHSQMCPVFLCPLSSPTELLRPPACFVLLGFPSPPSSQGGPGFRAGPPRLPISEVPGTAPPIPLRPCQSYLVPRHSSLGGCRGLNTHPPNSRPSGISACDLIWKQGLGRHHQVEFTLDQGGP